MAGEILIIDDDPTWTEFLVEWLRQGGYDAVVTASGGEDGVAKMQKRPPDVVILDLELPDISGLEVCRRIRAVPRLSRIPIVLMTAHKKERVLGLQSGADYFVGKSDKPHELLATLSAVFRRRDLDAGVVRHGDIVLRAQERSVHYKEKLAATLTNKMFLLFNILVQRSPQPVSRADLYREVEGKENPGESRALDILLNRLRKKLPDDLSAGIVNVKGFGYCFISQDISNKK